MEKILIVEDNLKLAETLVSYLGRSGYQVYQRHDGKEAYELLLRNTSSFDLVILDVMLPSMSGLEICQKLRAARAQLPIIMLTNIADTHSIVAALNVGADDYLTKPFAMAELLARTQAILRRPARFEGKRITVGGLVVDPNLREAWYKGEAVPLRRREFDLLYYLAKNHNQMVSREQIMLNLWSEEDEPFPNTIDSHVRQLRNKLAKIDPSARGIIKTVYGFGYKLGLE